MKGQEFTRRDFMRSAAMGSALIGLAGCRGLLPSISVRTPHRVVAADQKLNIACIGVGGQGRGDLGGVSSENIVALCDVDANSLGNAAKDFPDAKTYRDYRRMLVEMDEEIEAVTVSTPDHTHFAAAMMAIEMGKHVYVQKPMTRTIWEARRMTEAARRHRVSTQMGNQGHSNEWARLMKEWVEAGAIGDVTEVHFWSDRPIWPQGMSRPAEIQPVPPHLDWNLWLGTAPERPYNSAYCPFKWRGWWDFGCGALGDMGCHIMDAAFYALELGSPVRVEAETSPRDPESAPEWSIVTYHFPARGSRPPVKAVWYDGGKRPPRPAALEEGRDLMGGGNGSYLVGEKGGFMADCYCGSARIFPESLMEDFQGRRPEKTLPRSKGGHYQNWIQSCKEGGEPACSNFDYAGPLTEMVLLGNLAVRTGMPIEWDGKRMRVTNYPEANRYVREAMRKF